MSDRDTSGGGGVPDVGTYEEFVDPVDGTVWGIDLAFLSSNWTCIWNQGCQGIEDEPAPDRQLGCCSVGAELLDDDEAMRLAALAATMDETGFQFAAKAADAGVFADAERRFTRVVDGACIFLNRPGFAGGVGCALHLAALADDDDPCDWKPSVCWQLPLKVVRAGARAATLRRWQRADWGSDGAAMAWCCTEEPEAHIGTVAVAESMANELSALVGPEVAIAIRRRVRELE